MEARGPGESARGVVRMISRSICVCGEIEGSYSFWRKDFHQNNREAFGMTSTNRLPRPRDAFLEVPIHERLPTTRFVTLIARLNLQPAYILSGRTSGIISEVLPDNLSAHSSRSLPRQTFNITTSFVTCSISSDRLVCGQGGGEDSNLSLHHA